MQAGDRVERERELRRAALMRPSAAAKEDEARRVVAEAVTYVTNNRDKMNYPEYRRLGLPISSAPVESAIEQWNRRIKGSEKFWTSEGVEAVGPYPQRRATLLRFSEPRPSGSGGGTARSRSRL